MENVTFRKAAESDLPAIVDIYNEAIPGHQATADLELLTVQDKEGWFHSFTETHPLWVIEREAGPNEIIGWIGLEPFYGRPAYEHTAEIAMYIDTAWQHRGVGKKALSFVLHQLEALRIETAVAYIFGHNTPSLNLVASFGFKEWGRLPGVAELSGIKRDLVIMGYHAK